jgi:hypothetical protein
VNALRTLLALLLSALLAGCGEPSEGPEGADQEVRCDENLGHHRCQPTPSDAGPTPVDAGGHRRTAVSPRPTGGPAQPLGAWVIAADLINLPVYDPALDATFRAWITHKLDFKYGSRSMRQAAVVRPNNIGSSARFSRAAVSVYLDDFPDLAALALAFERWLGNTALPDPFTWHQNQTWQAHPTDPQRWVGINPRGAVRDGILLDGVQPDDQRRNDEEGPSGGLFDPLDFPTVRTTLYPEASLIASLGVAEILARHGYPEARSWGDHALERATLQIHRFAEHHGDKGYVYLTDTRQTGRPLVSYMFSLPLPVAPTRTSLSGSASEYSWTYFTHHGRAAR